MTRQGDYVWTLRYDDGATLIHVAYAPLGAAPVLVDVLADTADVAAAIVRLVQGYRPRVVGTWTTSTTGESP